MGYTTQTLPADSIVAIYDEKTKKLILHAHGTYASTTQTYFEKIAEAGKLKYSFIGRYDDDDDDVRPGSMVTQQFAQILSEDLRAREPTRVREVYVVTAGKESGAQDVTLKVKVCFAYQY